jgi:hypothetical protein
MIATPSPIIKGNSGLCRLLTAIITPATKNPTGKTKTKNAQYETKATQTLVAQPTSRPTNNTLLTRWPTSQVIAFAGELVAPAFVTFNGDWLAIIALKAF